MIVLALPAAVIVLAIMVFSGVSASSSVVLLAMVAIQVGAGIVVWDALAGRRDTVERLGMGAALGSGLALVTGIGLRLVGGPVWSWAIVPTVVIVVGAVRALLRRGHVTADRDRVDAPTWWALGIGTALGVGFIAANLRHYPLSWTGLWGGYHNDMPFFEALSTAVTRLGPFDSPFLPGAQVRYHWLVYGWSGQLSESAGSEPFVVLTRLLPAFTLLAAIALTVSWARRVSRVPWVPSLAVILLITGGFLGATYGGVLNFDSPSQSMGVVWLLALAVVLAAGLADQTSRRRFWATTVLVAALSFLLAGGKVSAALPALAGVLLVASVGLLRREPWAGTAVASAFASVIASGLAYALILSGASGSGGLGLFDLVDRSSSQQGLNPTDGMRGVILGTAILMVAMAARWAGLAWLVGDRRSRWDPMTLFGVGLAVTGLCSLIVFNGFNEIWFGLAASAPLAVLSAQGAGEAFRHLRHHSPRRPMVLGAASVAGAAVIYAMVFVLWATGASGGNVFVGTLRWTGPLVGVLLAMALGALIARWATGGWRLGAVGAMVVILLVLTTAPGRLLGVGTGQVGIQQPGLRNEWFSIGTADLVRDRDVKVVSEWSDTQMSAAAWLRENAGATDLLATNLTFGPFVPGITRLPTYVSALQYQAPYGRSSEAADLLRREGHVWDFIETPTAATATPLCEAGVGWLWIDPSLTAVRDWEPYATTVIDESDVIVARFRGSC